MNIFLRFLRERCGIAAIELAVFLPVLLAILLGTVEFGRYVLLNQKLQNAATSAADFATREETISAAQLSDIYSAAQRIVEPFNMSAQGRLVVSAVGSDGGSPTVLWQSSALGGLEATSALGAPGEAAVLTGSFAMAAGETAIFVEVYFQYTPWLDGIIPGAMLSKRAVFRPRFGGLDTLDG